MARDPMPDVVVLLPGITGSRLSKDGKVVWGFSAGSIAHALLTLGGSLRKSLTLEADPPDRDDLGDGVVADALLPDLHLLPGLWKIDGYSKVADTIQARFEVTEGQNFFAFPYDWRRDNRVSARKLARASHDWLRAWRARSGNAKAKLILVAHSMGGIVSRYFLEVMEGWKDTRALVSFGTPYRGSLNSVDALSNGMRKGPFGLIDLSEMGRSFTSLYQLLPIYECYDPGDGRVVRVGETRSVPRLDPTKAAAALAFHREIEDAQRTNAQNPGYREHRVFPIVGVSQETSQSALRDGDGVLLLPSHKGKDYSGDGTVPRVSATPIELSEEGREMFAATQHGSLQNADAVLTQLRELVNSFYFDLGGFRKPEPPPGPEPTRVALEVEDLFWGNEPVRIRARPSREGAALRATVRGKGGAGPVTRVELTAGAAGWLEAELAPLPEGAYRVRVESEGRVEPAEDSFAVTRDPAP